MRTYRTTILFGFLGLLIAGALLAGSTLVSRSADDDKGILAGLLSRALSTPAARVSIGSVDGALFSSSTISNVSVADRKGVWLQIDKITLDWTRSALLLRKLKVNKLEIGTVTILRRPLPNEQPSAVSDEPILPELPINVQIANFSLKNLTLGEPVIGTAAQIGATGALSLGKPSEGLNLTFDARRLDAAGTLTARLELVPRTERLTLKLAVDEPANGIAAHVLNIPNQPPVKLNLDGSGTLDNFSAQMAFDAGVGIGADGSAQLRRTGTTRQLNADMKARIEGLLPPMAAPIFAGTTQLNATVGFADGGAITVAPLTVMSQTARLDVTGDLTADQVADLKITARALPNAGSKTAAGGVEVGIFNFDAAVTGPLMGPRITATLDARDIATPQGKAQTIAATFEATPSGDVTEKTTAVPFNGRVRASGLSARDPALASALGSSLSLTLAGRWGDGGADVETAQIETATAQGRFNGRIGSKELKGRLTADVPDLAHFSGLSGVQLRGALGLKADLTGVPKDSQFHADLDGQATRFATGIAAIDGLAGGRVALKGRVSSLPAGGFGFGDLRLNGAHASARLDGQATVDRADIDVQANVPDLQRADSRLAGHADLTAKLTGTLERPDAKATLTVADAQALGRPIPRLVLETTATDIIGQIDARTTLSGTVDSKPAQGVVHVARQDDGGWRVNEADIRIGSVVVKGAVSVTADWLADGRMTIDAGNLDDLSPLALTKLAGELQADLAVNIADGGQNLALTAQARGVKAASASIDHLNARLNATDVYRKPTVDGTVSIDRAVIAGEQISQVRLVAQGATAASDITLTAQARGFTLDARGRLIASDAIRLDLSTFTAQRAKNRMALLNPTTLALRDGGVDIRNLAMTLNTGRLTINGHVGKTYDIAINAKAVPLSIADILMPKLGLAGTLNAEATIAGTADAPSGAWKLNIDNLTAPQTRDAGLPPIDINAAGRLADGRTTIDGTVGSKTAGSIRISGTVPLHGDGLALAAKGRINLGVTDRFLAQAGRRATGALDIDVKASGAIAYPEINGTATIAGGSYSDVVLGIRYTNISGRIVAHGNRIAIERLSAQTPNGGAITAQGTVENDAAAGFPGRIAITSNNAKLIENNVYSLVANLGLTLSGPLARSPTISGRIDVGSLDVTIPERLPTTLSPIPGTVHVAPPPAARARLAAAARDKARASRQPAFDATLDLTVSAPNRVFVRGRGVDAELGGDLRLRGKLSDPITDGAFEMRRGRISVAGTRLDFTRGRVVFTGDLMPSLDFVAQTSVSEVTAIITVGGSAREPSFTFSSEPDLPQDEVLSRILFSKASGGLSATQALQLAQVAAQFSGGGGNDAFERIRKSLGVDSLDVSVGANGNPTVGLSRSINRRLSVGVKTGTAATDSGVTVDFDVTRHLRLKGDADASGNTGVGAGVEWEY